MKKLSIEEKSQRYDEAIERAKGAHNSAKSDKENGVIHKITEYTIQLTETIFPELKESEDERIRKALIRFHKSTIDVDGIKGEDIIAWLERQSKKDEEILILKDQIESLHAAIKAIKETHRIELEKQGEQKETLCDKCKKAQPSHSCQDITALGRCTVEHEQKPIDNVEPKFEIGDLITNGILVGKIDEIHELGYHAYFGDHYADVPDIENWHKWTLKDAKDGDVLYSPTNRLIWIYKDNEHYHASINLNYADVVSFDNKIVVPSDVCPANRVQKSILFQKMEESGYKWDNEKKELKKISQRMVSAEAKEAMYNKPAWSEEDEKMLDFAIRAVGLCKQYAINHQVNGYSKLPDVPKRYEELQDWLKSIKERIGCEVNCTTTNKWSEEDEKILKTITSDVLRMRQKCGIGTDEWNIRSNALNWLKYHLSQRRWKPTEKQLMELKCAIRGCSFNIEQLVSLEEQLKQL